jgi:hypothetical protein
MANDDARVALAQRNGRPRDMAGMKSRIAGQTNAQQVYEGGRNDATATDGSVIERGPDGRVYRYVPKFDHTMIMNEDGSASSPMKGNKLPSNSMDAYIDKVAGMAGMTDVPTPTARPTDGGMTAGEDGMPAEGANIPVPTARPQMGPNEDANSSNGFTTAELILGTLGLGGAAAAARALYNKYNSKSGASADDITSIADTPEQRAGDMQQIDAEKTARLAPPAQQITETKALPAPPKALPAPNAVDDMINATEAVPDVDAAAQRFVEEGGDHANNVNRFSQQGSRDVTVNNAAALADKGDIRGAVKALRDAGIDIDDNMLRMLVENSATARSLKDRAAGMAGQAARRAVSQ